VCDVPNPQQPELRRNAKGAATDQDQRQTQVGAAGHPAHTDQRKEGVVPPDQQTVDERISEG
jgi:hypothetical protein